MVERLKQLDYHGAESRRNFVSLRLGFAMRRLENSLCRPSSEWVPFFRMREESERRGMGSAFHQLCPRYSGTLTPTALTAIRLWKTFTFTYISS